MASGGVPEIEGFEDLVLIARGGFSSVYRAVQPSAGRQVAIKVLTGTLDDETLPRFERECRALGRLAAHPGICTLYSSGRTRDGHPYLVMELGTRTLGERIRTEGPMESPEAVEVLLELADALGHAHGQGIVHRDVKPDNVLVTQFGRLVVTDFGIARMEDEFHTTDGLVTASLAHAAPEVLDGDTPTARSDVWSLASTGYQLLTGVAPFRRTGETPSAMIARVFRDPPPDLRAWGVPDAVASVLEAGLTKEPAERIPDMAELEVRLRSAVAESEDSQEPAGETVGRTRRRRAHPTAGGATDETRQLAGAPVAPPMASVAPGAPEPGPGPRRRSRRNWVSPVFAVAAVVLVVLGLSSDDGLTSLYAGVGSGAVAVVAGGLAARRRPRGPQRPGSRRRFGLWVLVGAFGALAVLGGLAASGAIGDDGEEPVTATTASSTTSSTTFTTSTPSLLGAPPVTYCVAGADADGLSIRATPGTRGADGTTKPATDVLGAIPEGTCGVRDAAADPEVADLGTMRWRRIEWNGIVGWSATGYLVPA